MFESFPCENDLFHGMLAVFPCKNVLFYGMNHLFNKVIYFKQLSMKYAFCYEKDFLLAKIHS